LDLGAGRKRAEDRVDPTVGIELYCELGQPLARGQTLAVLHMGKRMSAADASSRCQQAFRIGPGRVRPRRLVLQRISA
jgi:thymidine phosphorylase